MKKELYEKIRKEIIKEVLPIDEKLATIEDLTLDDNVCEFIHTTGISLENITRSDIKHRYNVIQKVLANHSDEIKKDNTGNLYVLLNSSTSEVLRYYNVENGTVRVISDNDEHFKFIKENRVIYLEDYFGKVEEKLFRKQAIKIRNEYFSEATRHNLDDATYLLIKKYRKK